MCRVICEAENIHNQVVNTNATKSRRIHDGQKGWGTHNGYYSQESTRVAKQTQHQRKLFIPVEEINILEEKTCHVKIKCQKWSSLANNVVLD